MAKVALVTGGTRGIGRAIVERLKSDGFLVAAGYAGNEEAAKACAEELGVMIVKGNVGDFEDCSKAVRLVEAELGPIDVLVNNAGITRDAMLHRMTPQQWNEVIYVNLASVFNMCRHVIEGMRERGYGRIINFSTVYAERVGPIPESAYYASKAGIVNVTRAVASEGGPDGITANCLAPAVFYPTRMTAPLADDPERLEWFRARTMLGRLGDPATDLTGPLLLLASDAGAYLTGQILYVDGGWSAW